MDILQTCDGWYGITQWVKGGHGSIIVFLGQGGGSIEISDLECSIDILKRIFKYFSSTPPPLENIGILKFTVGRKY